MLIWHCNCIDGFSKLQSESIDLIVTDPPYGINYKSGHQTQDNRSGNTKKVRDYEYFGKIINDDNLPLDWLDQAFRVLKPNKAIYIFSHWKTWGLLFNAVVDSGFKIKNMIILNKFNWGMGDLKGSFAPKHELLLFAAKGRHILNFEKRLPDIWNVPVFYSGAKRRHPTEKPRSWVDTPIKASSIEGDIVLDPFAGSGSFLEHAESLGRKAMGFELDDTYPNPTYLASV